MIKMINRAINAI